MAAGAGAGQERARLVAVGLRGEAQAERGRSGGYGARADGRMAIYLNRQLVRERTGVLWQCYPSNVNGLYYWISHMYGGAPASDPPQQNQLEWARDARVWASFY